MTRFLKIRFDEKVFWCTFYFSFEIFQILIINNIFNFRIQWGANDNGFVDVQSDIDAPADKETHNNTEFKWSPR